MLRDDTDGDFKRMIDAQAEKTVSRLVACEARLQQQHAELAERMRVVDTVFVAPGVQTTPPTEAEWDRARARNGNPLVSGWMLLVIYRWGRTVNRAPFQVAYWHRDFGAYLSRLESRGNRTAMRRGDVGFIAFDDRGELAPVSSSAAVATAPCPDGVECLAFGCTACGLLWRHPNAAGQCRACKRCTRCCEQPSVRYSCAWRMAKGGR